jgi:hypothetical protein
MRRHDSIRDSLARTLELGLFKDVRATVEPRVPNLQTGANLRRGGTRVAPRGSKTSVSCGLPGTQRYVDQGSQTTPGRAAEAYAVIKAAKYADHPTSSHSLWRLEATSPISSWTPYGGPRGPAPPPTPGPRGTVTPRRRAQGGDAGSGSFPSLHARRHCSGDSRGRPRSGVRAVARV